LQPYPGPGPTSDNKCLLKIVMPAAAFKRGLRCKLVAAPRLARAESGSALEPVRLEGCTRAAGVAGAMGAADACARPRHDRRGGEIRMTPSPRTNRKGIWRFWVCEGVRGGACDAGRGLVRLLRACT
jgi:hypothetical protein